VHFLNFMEQQILIQQIAIPFVLSFLGSWLILSAPKGDDWEPPFFWQSFSRLLPGALFLSLGIWAADLGRRGMLDQPQEWLNWSNSYRWEYLVFLVPVGFGVIALLRSLVSAPSKYSQITWPVSIFLAVLFMALCLSDQARGNYWTWKVLFVWMVAGVVAITANLASLDNMVASGCSRWALLILAGQMGCISAYAAQSYLSLSLWITSSAAIVFGATCCSVFRPAKSEAFGLWHLSLLMVPFVAATVPTLFIADRFSMDRLPQWLIGLVMFLPTIVWFFDIVYTRECRQGVRIFWAFVICASLLATIILSTKPFESDW
jgi:hypothetical protein